MNDENFNDVVLESSTIKIIFKEHWIIYLEEMGVKEEDVKNIQDKVNKFIVRELAQLIVKRNQ